MAEHWEFLVGIGVQTLLFLAGGYAMILRNDWSNKVMSEKVGEMQKELKKLAEIVTIQAVQTNRLDHLEEHIASIDKRVEDLRRGRGRVIEDED